MSETKSRRPKWELTQEALGKFLSSLDPDPGHAGEKYEVIRKALVSFFDWQGAMSPEDLTDETLNRVVRKIDEGSLLHDIPRYCHGVARLVLLEYRKVTVARRADVEELATIAAPSIKESADDRRECLKKCLDELPVESRQLVLRYYKDEKQQKIDDRATMADQLGIPINALRSRVQRLRDRLEQCVRRGMVRKMLRPK